MNNFIKVLDSIKDIDLRRQRLKVLQVNLGNLCNQSCLHCHIGAGPFGKNIISRKIIDDILIFLSQNNNLILDITGGAPELNSNFDYLVCSSRPLTKEIIVRSNLTVLFEPNRAYLPNLFKENQVHLICSLPCYTKENVDSQRGDGVFEKSIKALRILNDLGYGLEERLKLDLVHNPVAINLPLAQDKLEREYKSILHKEYELFFNQLVTITNVPIKRFKDYLEFNGRYQGYKDLLENNFNFEVLERLMCRSLLSVDWQGSLYDCDFNLALGLALKDKEGKVLKIDTINPEDIEGKEIIFDEHCFACTSGFGSSCQGALLAHNNFTQRQSVKHFYQRAAIEPKKELCCPASYQKEDVSYIPFEVLDVSYGCASPVSLAEPKEGEVVVDLGCGAGIDCFIAAKRVGLTGKVIGIDMTKEMLDKANQAQEEVARNLGFLNCEFRLGFLEDVPVESASVDLVTSNCVVNLSADKSKVFAQIYRILKSQGRFVISDIVADREPPIYMKNNLKLWGECISGALTQREFLSKAKEAGFYGLEILKNFKYKEVEGITFCSITVQGYKFKKSKDCVYIGQYATYLGPYLEVRDDDNHIFPRGLTVEICIDTAQKLTKAPYKGEFMITDVQKDGKPNPCCSQDNKTPCC